MREKLARYKDAGRPRCSKRCCWDSDYVCVLHESGLTSDEIGAQMGVSDEHIIKRLHKLGAKVRPRGSYTRGRNDRSRKGVLWSVEDEELFFKPIKELALKYHMSNAGVSYVRKCRKRASK